MKKGILISVVLAFVLLIGGCATLNNENYAQGKFINDLFLNQYDSSVAIEDQCYIIVLSIRTGISTIDGIDAGKGKGYAGALPTNSMTIVPQGKHTFSWILFEGPLITMTKNGEFEFELEAGNYYFLTVEKTGLGNNVKVVFENLRNHNEPLMLWGKTADTGQSPISPQSIIEGMNAKIKSRFPNFSQK